MAVARGKHDEYEIKKNLEQLSTSKRRFFGGGNPRSWHHGQAIRKACRLDKEKVGLVLGSVHEDREK